MATESKEKKKKQQQNMRKRSTSHTHTHTLAKTTTTEWSENTVTAIAKKGGERAQTFRYYVVSFSHITVSLWDGRHYSDGAYEDCALFVHYSLWHAQASTSDGVIMIDWLFFSAIVVVDEMFMTDNAVKESMGQMVENKMIFNEQWTKNHIYTESKANLK